MNQHTSLSFADLGLDPRLLQALEAEGYTHPTPIQTQAIPHVLDGRDLLGIAQTGTGKTAAFALPILQRLSLERLRAQLPGDAPSALTPIPISTRPVDDEDDVAEEDDLDAEDEPAPGRTAPREPADPADAARPGETAEEAEQRSRKRRRRRRGGRREEGAPASQDAVQPGIDPALADQPDLPLPLAEAGSAEAVAPAAPLDAAGEEEARGRRRGRRGGRRRRRDMPGGETPAGEAHADAGEEYAEEPSTFDSPEPARPAYVAPVYAGPTPADPFGGGVFDIYDVMEQAEARAAAAPAPASPEPPPAAAPDRPEQEAEAAEATLPAIEAETAPEWTAEPVAVIPPEPAPQPEPIPAITESRGAPPILVGAGDAAAEKKRGWWRR